MALGLVCTVFYVLAEANTTRCVRHVTHGLIVGIIGVMVLQRLLTAPRNESLGGL